MYLLCLFVDTAFLLCGAELSFDYNNDFEPNENLKQALNLSQSICWNQIY